MNLVTKKDEILVLNRKITHKDYTWFLVFMSFVCNFAASNRT